MSEKLASTPSPAAGGPADRVPLFFVGTEGPGSCLVGTGSRSKRLIETRREAGGGRCLMSETPRGGPTGRGWGQTPPALRVAACRRCPLARGLGGGAPPGQTLPPTSSRLSRLCLSLQQRLCAGSWPCAPGFRSSFYPCEQPRGHVLPRGVCPRAC